MRIASGYLVDRTSKYWLIAFLGYFCNLIAIPLLALVGSWQLAALLIILERIGKAIRTPSRDAMLSYATKKMGRGWGFGLHQVLDQIGGMLGPLIITVVLFFRNDYRLGFAILIIAFLLSSMFTPFVFLGNFTVALVGMILWGIGIGAQRSLLKAVIGDMVSKQIRGSAYGIFNTGYGVAWFFGSWLIGILYDIFIPWLIGFSIAAQLSAIPFIYIVQKRLR